MSRVTDFRVRVGVRFFGFTVKGRVWARLMVGTRSIVIVAIAQYTEESLEESGGWWRRRGEGRLLAVEGWGNYSAVDQSGLWLGVWLGLGTRGWDQEWQNTCVGLW